MKFKESEWNDDSYATFRIWVSKMMPIVDHFADNPNHKFAEVILAAYDVAMPFIGHFSPLAPDDKRRVELEYIHAVFDTSKDLVEAWRAEGEPVGKL